jgi:hypothetical protein
VAEEGIIVSELPAYFRIKYVILNKLRFIKKQEIEYASEVTRNVFGDSRSSSVCH